MRYIVPAIFLLSLCLCYANPAPSSLKFELNSDRQSYKVSKQYDFINGKLIIPSKYKGKPVTVIADFAFNGCYGLSSVIIPDSVTSIGRFAFAGCRKLLEIKIGKRVETIGPSAFGGCEKLSRVTIPESVTRIDSGAFSRCKNISIIRMGSGIKNINSLTFAYCDSLEKIILGEKLQKIGDQAFKNCTSLKNIDIPLSVRQIHKNAFIGCKKLFNIKLPAGCYVYSMNSMSSETLSIQLKPAKSIRASALVDESKIIDQQEKNYLAKNRSFFRQNFFDKKKQLKKFLSRNNVSSSFRWGAGLTRPLLSFAALLTDLDNGYNQNMPIQPMFNKLCLLNYRSIRNDFILNAMVYALTGELLVVKRVKTYGNGPRYGNFVTPYLNYYNPKALRKIFKLFYSAPFKQNLVSKTSVSSTAVNSYSVHKDKLNNQFVYTHSWGRLVKKQISKMLRCLPKKSSLQMISRKFYMYLQQGDDSWTALKKINDQYIKVPLEYSGPDLRFDMIHSEDLIIIGFFLRRQIDGTLKTLIDIAGTILFHYDKLFFSQFKNMLKHKGYSVTILL